jgi:hypothetical protein
MTDSPKTDIDLQPKAAAPAPIAAGGHKPAVLVILDGVGVNPSKLNNAVRAGADAALG